MSCGRPEPVPGGEAAPTTARQGLTAVRVTPAVAAGAYHSLFLRKNGEVWAWGQNTAGQLGTGSTSPTPLPTPVKVNGLPPIKALAAGVAHSLALDTQGNVWAWGENASGQAGLGSAGGTVLVPTRVASLSGIEAIAANGGYSLALGTDGRLWAWGQNTSGQIGTGATSASVTTPVLVPGLPTLRSIAAGLNHALALDTQGKVWGWGQNTYGQVGTGATSAAVLVPVQVTRLPLAKAIAAGGGHSLIVDVQFGNVWAWGQNDAGQAGSGTSPVLVPKAVSNLFAITSISAGHSFSVAIFSSGLARAWGQNASGQLGNGGTANSASGVNVTGLGDAKAVAAGAAHVVAIRPGCPVWTWGSNSEGQLGTGVTSPTPVTAPVQSLITNTFYFDEDKDGYGDESRSQQACKPSTGYVEEVDCDDKVAATHPGALETCNGVDDSCDGVVDDGNPGGGAACATGKPGVCGPGTTACVEGAVACQQNEAESAERCDSLDNDCDGESDEGNPGGLQACATGKQGECGEGLTSCTQGAIECVQQKEASAEVCDGKDNDCNGQTDDGLSFQTWYLDADGDNYGLTEQSVQACMQPSGHASSPSDCNDSHPGIHPGAVEVCDGVDNNCNGTADEGVGSTWYRDADGDGYGSSSQTVRACSQPSGYVSNASDCNDSSAAIKPGGAEVCDGVDNNCNGSTDEGVGSTWYRDADGDGYGNASQPVRACSQPSGYVSNASDCNDSTSSISPAAWDGCDGVDNNCNGSVDEEGGSTWYRDADGDGYGNSAQWTESCSRPGGYVSNASDCNDSNASIRPGASEVCDGVDNNCSGSVDEGVQTLFYWDGDNDGYGSYGFTTYACSRPANFSSNVSDCNDFNAAIHPGAPELCDGVDNNCNGMWDEPAKLTWYRDADSDGYGTSSQSTQACSQPGGYVSNASDCNDSNSGIRPGAPEVCDSVDNNCNGAADEGLPMSIWYEDKDGDGYGHPLTTRQACSQPPGYVSNVSDCDDSNASLHPGATEICDSIDNNCSGVADEGGVCTPVCEVGYTLCGGSCTNLQTDLHNCGECGNSCVSDGSYWCNLGRCGG